MTNKAAFLLLVLVVGAIAGCKRQKIHREQVALASGEGIFTSMDFIPDSLSAPLDFRYLSTRSKISFKSRKQNIDNASVTFRMKKDSAIWMSASMMGLEVLRGIISTEGVRIMDRVGKVYTEATYRDLAGKLGFPLDYPLLQGFFLADIPVYPGQGFEVRNDASQALVKQSDSYIAIYNMIDRLSKKTIAMEAVDLITDNRARAGYSNIQQVGAGAIPYNLSVDLSIRSKTEDLNANQLRVALSHSSVSITDSTLSFPFQVPINYKKAF